MAKIGYTHKPDGQNRVPPSTLVPGSHRIGQRPPRPDPDRISNGTTRSWLLTPPSAIPFQSHLLWPGYSTSRRVIDAAGHFCGRRGRACGRTLTSLCSLHVNVCRRYICRLDVCMYMSYVHDAALLYHILRIYVAPPPNS